MIKVAYSVATLNFKTRSTNKSLGDHQWVLSVIGSLIIVKIVKPYKKCAIKLLKYPIVIPATIIVQTTRVLFHIVNWRTHRGLDLWNKPRAANSIMILEKYLYGIRLIVDKFANVILQEWCLMILRCKQIYQWLLLRQKPQNLNLTWNRKKAFHLKI